MPVRIGAGRPSKYTPEMAAAICESVSNGVPITIASMTQGVSYATVTRWQQAGRTALDTLEAGEPITEKEQQFADFVVSLQQARGIALEERVAQIAVAGQDDWRASAWYLERQIPQEFGQISRHEVTGRDGGPIELSQAEIMKQASQIVAAASQQAQLTEGSE